MVGKTEQSAFEALVGCSGWYYYHWKGKFYPEQVPKTEWFDFYQQRFRTVELNAPFYRWPSLDTVRRWIRAACPGFTYSVKVNRLITHQKRFHSTAQLIRDFYELLCPMGEKLACVLFQLPPSLRFDESLLDSIIGQLDPAFVNVVEFRHTSWWNERVYRKLKEAGVTFCSVSAPSLPDRIVLTTQVLYIRFHGIDRWYRYEYSEQQLAQWAARIRESGATRCFAYFNNDWNGAAPRNASKLAELLGVSAAQDKQHG